MDKVAIQTLAEENPMGLSPYVLRGAIWDALALAEKAEARAEAAEAQVAALRDAANVFYREVYLTDCGVPSSVTTKALRNASQVLSDTATAAKAYEARIRTDERRKVLEVVNLMATCLHTSRECPQWMTSDFSYATEMFRGGLAALDAKEGGE